MPSKTVKVLLIVGIVLVVLFVSVLGLGYYFLVSKMGLKMQFDKEGSRVEMNNMITENGKYAKWPIDMPSSVPEFLYGKIFMSMKSKNQKYPTWSVMYTNSTPDARDKYKEDLIQNGWTINTTDIDTTRQMDFNAEKGKVWLFFSVQSTGQKDMTSLMVMLKPE